MTAWDKNAEVAGTFEVLGTNMGRIILAEHDKNLRKYINRHRRRHGQRGTLERWGYDLHRFLRRAFNIREGRAPYHVIRKRFVNGARLNGTHLCILVIAMVIACVGLDTDSDIAIVGAMLICPIMGSVLAIAYGMATVDRALIRDAVGGLALQMAFCLVTSTLYFHFSPVAGMTQALADNSNPTAWDLLLALVGGFAGGLGNSRDQEPATLISGVAVATSLMPPLCAAGFGLAAVDGGLFLSALYEFGINVVFIALSAQVVLLLLRVPLKRDLNDDGIVTPEEERDVQALSHVIRWRILLGTMVFTIPCLMFTANLVRAADDPAPDAYGASETARELAVACPGFEEYAVGMRTRADSSSPHAREELVARVSTDSPLDAEQREIAEGLIRLDVPEIDRVEFATASS